MKPCITFVISIVLLFLSVESYTQNLALERWNVPPGGGGGIVWEGKDGALFIADSGGNIYRSLDFGGSWDRMQQVPWVQNAGLLSVGQDTSLLAIVGDKIFRSTDNGITWAMISETNVSLVTILTGGILLKTYDGKISRSTDGGASWQQVLATSLSLGGGFAFNKLNGDIYLWTSFYGNNPGAVLKSSDLGLTWVTVLQESGVGFVKVDFSPTGIVYAGGGGYVYKSYNNGTTWEKKDPFPFSPAEGSNYTSIGVTHSGRVLAYDEDASFYSDDEGVSWWPLKNAAGHSLLYYTVTTAGRIIATSFHGSLYQSEDNGASWRLAAKGFHRTTISDIKELSSDHWLALTVDGLFYSDNDGGSWQLKDSIIQPSSTLYVNRLASDHAGNWYCWNGTALVRYSNEGTDKTILPFSLSAGDYFQEVEVNPYTQSIFVLTYTHLYRSDDQGDTWASVGNMVLPNLIFFADGSMGSSQYFGFFRSLDGGVSWTKQTELHFEVPAKLGADGNLYGISENYKLNISNDEGVTWQATAHVNSSWWPGNTLAINTAGQVFVVADDDNYVYRSVDNGLSFNAAGTHPDMNTPFSRLFMGQSQQLYVLTQGDGAFRSVGPTTVVKLLKGNLLRDDNPDCIPDPSAVIAPGTLVRAVGNSTVSYSASNTNGQYVLPVGPYTYDLEVIPPSAYWKGCAEQIAIPDTTTTGLADSIDLSMEAITHSPLVEVHLTLPRLRRCVPAQAYVNYLNKGTLDANDVYVDVSLDSLMLLDSASIGYSQVTPGLYRFVVGTVAVGASGRFSVSIKPLCSAPLGYRHCMSAHLYPDTLSPAFVGGHIVTGATCQGDSVWLEISNVGNAPMLDSLEWFVVKRQNWAWPPETAAYGKFKLDAGESFGTLVPAYYHGLNFRAAQVPVFPYNHFSQVVITGCGSDIPPGSIPNITRDDEEGPFTDVVCRRNTDSYDPNEKNSAPEGIGDGNYIPVNQRLTYTIYFQNTGTDTAINISVKDRLPVTLDLSTFVWEGSSHPCHYKITPDRELIVNFERIYLPDSFVNEAASHGFIQFSILPVQELPDGAYILNNAAIYFDQNPAVITNTDRHRIGSPVLVEANEPDDRMQSLLVFPIPFEHNLTVAATGGPVTLQCYDMLGRCWFWKGNVTGAEVIQASDWPAGMYIITASTADGKITGRRKVVHK